MGKSGKKAGRVPQLRRHRGTGQGLVRLSSVDHYCGVWPQEDAEAPPEVRAKYDQHIAEWLARGRRPAATRPRKKAGKAAPAEQPSGQNGAAPAPQVPPEVPAAHTVAEVVAAYLQHAQAYYAQPGGARSTEFEEVAHALRPVVHIYALLPAAEFSPLKLKAARGLMVSGYEHARYGQQGALTRGVINKRVSRIKRAFAWMAAEELVPPLVPAALRSVSGLLAGRTEAREAVPVAPVPLELVERTLPHMPPHTAGLARFMCLTGARPGEACRLTLAEIDRAGAVWLYAPARHTTRHRGKRRVIAIGPRAQALLLDFVRVRCPLCGTEGRPPLIGCRDGALCGPCADRMDEEGTCGPWRREEAHSKDDPVFSPIVQRGELYRAWRAVRRSKVTPSQKNRKKAKPERMPGRWFRPEALAHAVAAACRKGGLTHWHPNQLRHKHATEVRRQFGLEAAQAALGHARADVTQVYAERDIRLAAQVAREVG